MFWTLDIWSFWTWPIFWYTRSTITTVTVTISTTINNNLIAISSRNWCNRWSGWFQYSGEWFCYPAEALDPPPRLLPSASPLPTTSSPSTLEADVADDLFVFNIAVNDVAILVKPWINVGRNLQSWWKPVYLILIEVQAISWQLDFFIHSDSISRHDKI